MFHQWGDGPDVAARPNRQACCEGMMGPYGKGMKGKGGGFGGYGGYGWQRGMQT